MRETVARALLAACGLLLLAVVAARGEERPAAPAGAAAAPPLTDEAIVRMVVQGETEAAIRERITRSPAAFDLSPAMIAELREAGVSEAILAAMRRRQEEVPRPQPAAAPETTSTPPGVLEIDFLPAEGDDAEAPAALALAAAPKGVRGRRSEIPVMSDLAFVVLCTTADHVPDHWDSRTPLSGAPRHEVVLFRAGSEPLHGGKPAMLALKHEPSYRVELPPGTHNIVVGAAGRMTSNGEWRLIASDGARVAIEAGRTTRLELRARGRSGGVTARFVPDNAWTIGAVERPAAMPAPAVSPPETSAPVSPAPVPSPSPDAAP